jgi:nucleoid-associated protein YgaU
MLLGTPQGRWRCLLVWSAVTVPLAGGTGWSLAAARPVWAALSAGSLGAQPLDRALAGLAATALVACGCWAWVAMTATVLEAARGVRVGDASRAWHLPGGVRRALLAACGAALVGSVASPALADGGGHGRQVLVGLPLPDRATAPRHDPAADEDGRSTGPSPHLAVVSAGDSLWSIAAEGLPAEASDARITARWHAIYAANRSRIGPDPDLLEPGQRLRLPREDQR